MKTTLCFVFVLLPAAAYASPHVYIEECLSGKIRKPACAAMIENFWRHNYELDQAARAKGLDPSLIKAMAAVESRFNAQAISPKGATGLLQIMPATGSTLGVSRNNLATPSANALAGAQYVRNMYYTFGDWRLAIAAYNAGPGAVKKYGNQIPPYAETQSYVVQVLALYARFKQSERLHTRGAMPPPPVEVQLASIKPDLKPVSVAVQPQVKAAPVKTSQNGHPSQVNRFKQPVTRVGRFQYLEGS